MAARMTGARLWDVRLRRRRCLPAQTRWAQTRTILRPTSSPNQSRGV